MTKEFFLDTLKIFFISFILVIIKISTESIGKFFVSFYRFVHFNDFFYLDFANGIYSGFYELNFASYFYILASIVFEFLIRGDANITQSFDNLIVFGVSFFIGRFISKLKEEF